jgi:hypothetical protein
MGNISQYDSGERCDPWASCFFNHSNAMRSGINLEALPNMLQKGKNLLKITINVTYNNIQGCTVMQG